MNTREIYTRILETLDKDLNGKGTMADKHAYYRASMEPVDICEAYGLSWHSADAVVYILRAGKKSADPVSDLIKAHWHLTREILLLAKPQVEPSKAICAPSKAVCAVCNGRGWLHNDQGVAVVCGCHPHYAGCRATGAGCRHCKQTGLVDGCLCKECFGKD